MHTYSVLLAVLLISQATCFQTSYVIHPERCEVTDINRTLVHFGVKRCFKLSRSELFLNISFFLNVDIRSNDIGQMKITGYQFRSNEYRKGPVEFMMGLCAAFTSKDFDIPHILSSSNLKCPLIKGRNYYAYQATVNATNMPPLIPAGKWMLELQFLYKNNYALFTILWYSEVEYILPFQKY